MSAHPIDILFMIWGLGTPSTEKPDAPIVGQYYRDNNTVWAWNGHMWFEFYKSDNSMSGVKMTELDEMASAGVVTFAWRADKQKFECRWTTEGNDNFGFGETVIMAAGAARDSRKQWDELQQVAAGGEHPKSLLANPTDGESPTR